MYIKNIYKYRNIFACLIVFVLLGTMFLSAAPVSAYSNVYESESNNTLATADVICDQDYNYGAISSTSDVDWWKFTYSVTGMVNLYLANIPTGCNYNLYVYDASGNLIASSINSLSMDELIRIRVKANTTYYVKVMSSMGSSSNYYLFRIKRYALKSVDIFTSDSSPNDFRSGAINSLPILWGMGYDAGEYLNNTAAVALGVMHNLEIFVNNGHGWDGWATFYHADGSYSNLYGMSNNLGTGDASMSALEYGALTGVSLVIYTGCRSGVTSEVYGNLIQMTREKGAWCAIGWRESINTVATNAWLVKFFEYCSHGCTIETAMANADEYIREAHSTHYNNLAQRFVAGSARSVTLGYS